MSDRILRWLLLRFPRKFLEHLCGSSYWRGFNDGRIFGKERNEAFTDEYWMERYNGTTPAAIRQLEDLPL